MKWQLRSPGIWLFAKQSFQAHNKETWKLIITGPLWGESTVTSGFPSQRASNAENIPMPWHQHEFHVAYFPNAIESFGVLYFYLLDTDG